VTFPFEFFFGGRIERNQFAVSHCGRIFRMEYKTVNTEIFDWGSCRPQVVQIRHHAVDVFGRHKVSRHDIAMFHPVPQQFEIRI
jgi:hypothetical protein